jgi:hypothetical protein
LALNLYFKVVFADFVVTDLFVVYCDPICELGNPYKCFSLDLLSLATHSGVRSQDVKP